MQSEIVNRHADGTRRAMLERNMNARERRRPGTWGTQRGRLHWFVVVGSAAAAVHWLVAVGLVNARSWHPLLANVAGWLAAFGVSFAGHHRLTFRSHGSPVVSSATRFFMISAGGFAINETAYAMLLAWTRQRYDLLLAAVLLAVAAITYWLSRHWAFARNEVR
jgi:putative flippase GtrA